MELDLIEANTNLGLRPEADGKLAGTREAAGVLLAHGLDALVFRCRSRLDAPAYERDAQAGTRIRNGQSLRRYGLALAEAVHRSLGEGAFPLVLGGDCSNLMGCLLGLRQGGGRGVVHVDGHSDFFHPGNYDTASRLGSAAGMDLALATGRGEALLTQWPGLDGPLAVDADVVQLGEREKDDFTDLYREVSTSEILQLTVQDMQQQGMNTAIERTLERLGKRGLAQAWLHLDLDVLDEAVMAAVDSPGAPGLDFDELRALLRGLLASGRIVGADVTIYDPDRDPDRRSARAVAQLLVDVFSPPTRT